jgi:CDP-4-dehydro-6-deoxyglucose reductase
LKKNFFLFVTGTGIAPFRSMAHYIQTHDVPHKNIYLIFGCRKCGDALYAEDMTGLSNTLENFYYLPIFQGKRRLEGKKNRLRSQCV